MLKWNLLCELWELAKASVRQHSQWHLIRLGEQLQIDRSGETLRKIALAVLGLGALPLSSCTDTPLVSGSSVSCQSDFVMAPIFTAWCATPFPIWSADGAIPVPPMRWGWARTGVCSPALLVRKRWFRDLGVSFPCHALPEATMQIPVGRMTKKIVENYYNGHIQCWFRLWAIVFDEKAQKN